MNGVSNELDSDAFFKWVISVPFATLAFFVTALNCEFAFAEQSRDSTKNNVYFAQHDSNFEALFLDVSIAGLPVKALLDTGSNYLIVDDGLEDLLGDKLSSKEVTRITGFEADQQTAITPFGRVEVEYYNYPGVLFQELQFPGTISMMQDLSFISSVIGAEIGAIIGSEQLEELTIKFDKPNARLILSEDFVSAEIDESKFERLDLIENRSKLPVVAANVETLTESFLIDTGSNAFGTLHPGVIQDIGASVIATNNAVATVQDHWRKSYIHVDSFRMGNSEYGKQLFSVSEFNTIGWTCPVLVPPQVLVYATFRSKATGLFQPNAECRRRGL